MKVGDRVVVVLGDLTGEDGEIVQEYLGDNIPCLIVVLDSHPEMTLYFKPRELRAVKTDG